MSASFKLKQKEYASIYGRTVRGIKKWIAIGRAAMPPELPPLDHPDLMAGWWKRHMKNATPLSFPIVVAPAPAPRNWEASTAVCSKSQEARTLLHLIELELASRESHAHTGRADWSDAGSVGKAASDLRQLCVFLQIPLLAKA